MHMYIKTFTQHVLYNKNIMILGCTNCIRMYSTHVLKSQPSCKSLNVVPIAITDVIEVNGPLKICIASHWHHE